jgi:hypothetical protein
MGANREHSSQSKKSQDSFEKQIRQIAASIRKFGFLNPLIVDDENMILAGHGRLEGARLARLMQRFDEFAPGWGGFG